MQEFIGPTVSFSDKRQFREQFCLHLVREGIVINFILYVLDTCMVRLTPCVYGLRTIHSLFTRNLQRLLMTTVFPTLPPWCSSCLVWFTTWTDPPLATWLVDCTCVCVVTCTHTLQTHTPYPIHLWKSVLYNACSSHKSPSIYRVRISLVSSWHVVVCSAGVVWRWKVPSTRTGSNCGHTHCRPAQTSCRCGTGTCVVQAITKCSNTSCVLV